MDTELAIKHRARIEEFRRKHHTGLVTLLFTDIVGSTLLKRTLGDREGVAVIQEHHELVRDILKPFVEAEEISTSGDSFLIAFVKPSDAVRFSLRLQAILHDRAEQISHPIFDRIGIHIGEVVIEEHDGGERPKDLYGIQVDICSRVMSLGEGGQILATRSVFDNARQVLKGEDIEGVGELSWLNHGTYLVKGVEEPMEVCEIGDVRVAPLMPPSNSEKAQRQVSPNTESVLGWRPAVGVVVPQSYWRLTEKLGEGGFGEVWVVEHQKLKEKRVFKFCFKADRVRSLKREVTLFRLLKEKMGEHPNIVRIHEVYFDEAPFYVVMDYVEGTDLKTWCEQQGGIGEISLIDRLEIVAQTADALEAAHGSGVVHRDVKPGNILVSRRNGQVQVKLTDFGIGQVLSEEFLAGMTGAGFTMTLMGATGSQSGTQMYMAPELLAGSKATPQSDIYSLGVVLYQLLIEDFSKTVTIDWAHRIDQALIREDLEQCFAGEPEGRFAAAGLLAEKLRGLEKRREQLALRAAKAAAREKAAYRRGMMRTATVAALILAAVTVLAVFAFDQAETARENADEANRQRQRAENVLQASQIQKAEEYFQSDDSAFGISELARVIRENPTNHVAAARLSSALIHRSFALPISEPLRHRAWVVSAQFSPDGDRVVTASRDRSARVWDVRTGAPITEPLLHDGAVIHAQFSPDGKHVVTATSNGYAQVWDVANGLPLGEPLPIGGGSNLRQLFSLHGRFLVTIPSSGRVQIWDLVEQSPLGEPVHHHGELSDAVLSPNGSRLILVSGADGIIKSAQVWDLETRKPVGNPIRIESNAVFRISPDGGLVVSGSGDTIQVWDVETGLVVGEPLQHESAIDNVEFSPDGQRLVVTLRSPSMIARVWDIRNGQRVGEPLKHNDGVACARFSPDGQRVVTSSIDRTARIWDAFSGRPLTEPLRHRHVVVAAQFSPDGERVVTASRDSTAQVWDVRVGHLPSVRLVHPHGRVLDAQFSPDGRSVVTGSADETARLWDARSGRPLMDGFVYENPVASAQFSSDGRWLVTICGYFAQVLDARTGQAMGEPLRHDHSVISAQFSSDGLRVVTASRDTTARLWDAQSGRPLCEPLKHPMRVHGAQFSSDGRHVVTAGEDSVARVWDGLTGAPIGKPLKHEADVLSAEFSPDGKRIATACFDWVARLWDIKTGVPVIESMRHDDIVYSARFSPDGRWVLTASRDGTARVWDGRTGDPVGAPLHHGAGLKSANFSSDGKKVVTAGGLAAQVWDAQSGQPLTEAFLHESFVPNARFSPDGHWVVTASGAARLWNISTARATPVPDWFARWGEIIGGRRRTDHGLIEAVPVEDFIKLRRETMKRIGKDDHTRVARWFFADSAEKTISPFSTFTRSDYVRQRLDENTVESLRETLFIAPTNGVALARLALRTLEQDARPDTGLIQESRFYAERAVKWAPNHEEPWIAFSEIQMADERLDSAEIAVDQALKLNSDSAVAWRLKARVLERREASEEALGAYGRAIEQVRGSDLGQFVATLKQRANLLRELGRGREATEDIHQAYSIEPRPSGAIPGMIDLSNYYNAGFSFSGAADERFGLWPGNDLSELPTGIQSFGGVTFDVRGLIQLGNGTRLRGFPNKVEGIRVDQTCRRIYFVHGVAWGSDSEMGKEISKFLLHYSDGRHRECPIVFGHDVLDYWADTNIGAAEITNPNSTIAWIGSNKLRRANGGGKIQLFRTTWENPRPDEEIASIDFLVSRIVQKSAPFLVAISVE